jgi:hypothetical protein
VTRKPHSFWSDLGVALAVGMVLAGLVLVGLAVLFVVGMNNYGSNK